MHYLALLNRHMYQKCVVYCKTLLKDDLYIQTTSRGQGHAVVI